jgi:hypothetical protein
MYITNKEVCEELTTIYNGNYAEELEEIGDWVNKDVVTADSFFISIHVNSNSTRTINDETNEFVVITNIIEYQRAKKTLFSLNRVPDIISFNKHTKAVRFIYTGSFAFKTDEKISVLFIAKKISFPVCEFKATNYPPWYLNEWIYEIKPQWYILYNSPSDEFVKRYNSLNNLELSLR